ncbi:hypothetical protein I6J32_04135 [Moraxella osloensis]|uniref:hypothetical protein n=1 Tax=Faucicola osloensis TaxID=34062 RepID=UPI00194ECF26|nr:hypothetical protein [Moraxella osloensis]QRO14049.1 hypothetical protein I6J32_04135 [Moraxella osloensis]
MRNLKKLIYTVFLILIGTSYADAKLIPINKNDPNAKYLMYVDFDKKIDQSPNAPFYLITTQTESVDEEDKKDYPSVNFDDYSKVWLTEDYLISCNGEDSYITNENPQLMGTYKHTNITVTIPSGTYASISRPLDQNNETDKLIYEQTCEPK